MHRLTEGDGKLSIELALIDTGNGLVCCLTGGERPHVGGIALATPRDSLSGSGRSADVAVIPVPGHLDTEVAAPMAKRLCIAACRPVSITAGIHIDGADASALKAIQENCQRLTERAEEFIKNGWDASCRL